MKLVSDYEFEKCAKAGKNLNFIYKINKIAGNFINLKSNLVFGYHNIFLIKFNFI